MVGRAPVTVQVYSHSPDASAFYRLIEPARVLGVEVVENPGHVTASTVVTNRPVTPEVSELVCRWAAEGRRVIVDNDDDFDAIPPEHGISGRYNNEHMHRACKAAAVNTVSTAALARRYGYNETYVLPNCIPASYLKVAPRGRREPTHWVGWSGSISAHPRDLEVVGDGLRSALKTRIAQTVYLGPKEDVHEVSFQLGCVPVTPLGFVSLVGFPSVIGEFTIGIVPLARNAFNDSKSWLKGLELAAVGVPVIASPTPDYLRLYSLGGCLLARNPDEWRDHLGKLLDNQSYRREVAKSARDMAQRWTYERRAQEWRSVWGM